METIVQVQSVIYHNDKESLERAYESLANSIRVSRDNGMADLAVVVHYGDASSAPVYSQSEIEAIQKKYEQYFFFRYTFFNENTGTSKGHNKLGLTCEANYIVVMNPDVIVCPRFFEKMLHTFADKTKHAGVAEARQSPIEHSKVYDRKTLETDWATGACFMVPKELYCKIGGFDEQTFFMYCDDVDFSWRIRLEGWKIYYRPDCVVFHAKRLSSQGNWQPTSAEMYYSREAALLMAYKWSNHARFKKLYADFLNSDEIGAKVIARFEEMKANGKLPQQLDPEGRVACFVGDYFTEHRFIL